MDSMSMPNKVEIIPLLDSIDDEAVVPVPLIRLLKRWPYA